MNTQETLRTERRASIPNAKVANKMDQFGAANLRLQHLSSALSNPISNRGELIGRPGIIGRIAKNIPKEPSDTYMPDQLSALAQATKLSGKILDSKRALRSHSRKLLQAPSKLESKHIRIISQNPNIPFDKKAQRDKKNKNQIERLNDVASKVESQEGINFMIQTIPSDVSPLTMKVFTEQYAKIDTTSPTSLNFSGLIAASQGDREQAQKLYEQALMADPNYPGAHTSLGCLLLESDPQKAEVHFRKAIESDPENPILFKLLGDACRIQGQISKAKAFHKMALEIDPENFDALFALGYIHSVGGEFDESERYFRKASEIDPEDPNLLVNLSFNRASLGRLDEAKEYCKHALEIDPENRIASQALQYLENYGKPRRNGILRRMGRRK